MSDSSDQEEDQQQALEDPDDTTLRIMLSTDNHLGYAERDPVRGMDSFAAFEEVLYLAKRYNCDMVLLAGDLFHENRPSRQTLYKAMNILRKYCLGPGAVRVQLLSDPTLNFASSTVNYQDPNFAVDLPVFSIHGNHDDPVREGTGQAPLAALDLLSVSNLVNYMGKQEKIDQVEISPVLLQKGTTRVALYGLGSMRDERLNRMWNSQKVKFLRPTPEEEDEEEEDEGFFNIFALHQNRDLGRGSKNCIQETMLPEWLDLVVWGHEHECLIEFFESVVGTFRITQPGSSVATSLVSGEAARKKVGILDIKGKNFRMHTVPLTQVRPFITTEISLKEHREKLDPDDPRIDEQVTALLQEEVNVLAVHAREKQKKVLQDAKEAGSDAHKADLQYKMEKPHEALVRIRVEHSGFTTLNNQRFGAAFVGKVANPEDILLFHRKKDPKSAAPRKNKKQANEPIAPEELRRTDMDDLVTRYLEAPDAQLKVLSEKTLGEALEEYVDKNLTSSLDDAADEMLGKKQRMLIRRQSAEKGKPTDDSMLDDSRVDDSVVDDSRVDESMVDATSSSRRKRKASDESMNDSRNTNGKENSRFDDDDEDMDEEIPPPKVARSKKKATASRTSKAVNSKHKASRRQRLPVDEDEEDSDDEVVEVVARQPRKKRAVRGQRVQYAADSDEKEDSDEEEAYKPKKKTTSKVASSSRKTTTSGSARKKPARKATARHKFDDSDDDVVCMGSSADMDEDWGTHNTKSQF